MRVQPRQDSNIPSIERLLPVVTNYIGLLRELGAGCSLDDIGLETPQEYLVAAESAIFPYAKVKGWDNSDIAVAVFRTYQALVRVTGKNTFQDSVRLVSGLCKEDAEDAYNNRTWIEYRDEEGTTPQIFEFRTIPSLQNYACVVPVHTSPWGAEARYPAVMSGRSSIFRTGIQWGIC